MDVPYIWFLQEALYTIFGFFESVHINFVLFSFMLTLSIDAVLPFDTKER